jgi:hypothetical protein
MMSSPPVFRRVLVPRSSTPVRSALLAVGLLAGLCIAAASSRAVAQSIDPVEATRRIARGGAVELALARVEANQPRDAAGPRWTDWEALRLALLNRLGRHDDALRRAAALPAQGLVPAPERTLRLEAARAAVAAGRGVDARGHLARLLWLLQPAAEDEREARLVVIDSYLADRAGEEALRAMLRFQLDHPPLDRAIAARFVEGLLRVGLDKEAVNWLALVDEQTPPGLLLRLRTGLVQPAAAVSLARTQLGRAPSADWWAVVLQAGALQKQPALQVEALEQMLQLARGSADRELADRVEALWRAYAAAAQDHANQNQLLVGDDSGWFDRASRALGQSPAVARALFGALVRGARSAETQRSSQLQLAFSLEQSGLGATAVRLFDDAKRFPAGSLDPQARVVLGQAAHAAGMHATAARFWRGLAPPPGVTAEDWALRTATAFYRAADVDAGSKALQLLLDSRRALAPDLVARLLSLAGELLDVGRAAAGGELLARLLPQVESGQRREALGLLARSAEQQSDFRAAADHQLHAATLADVGAVDAASVTLRMQAAGNLARAGLREDARAVYEWVLRNVRDATALDTARRELRRL